MEGNFRNDIYDLFHNTIISSSEKNSLIHTEFFEKVNGIIENNFPERFFRYRPLGIRKDWDKREIKAFKDNNIYAGLPSAFNDPFDCLPKCDKKAIDKQFEDMTARDFPEEIWDYVNLYNDLPSELKAVVSDKEWPEALHFYKTVRRDELRKYTDYHSFSPQQKKEYAEKEFTPELIYCINQLKDACKVASLSECCDDHLMWGHYANSYKGFVLEYDFRGVDITYNCNSGETGKGFLLPVLYTNSRYDATRIVEKFATIRQVKKRSGNHIYFDDDDVNYSYKILLYKKKCWKYENEWRLIFQDKTYRPSVFMTIKPTSIIYGNRIDEQNQQKLSVIAKACGVKEKKVIINYFNSDFEIDIKDL